MIVTAGVQVSGFEPFGLGVYAHGTDADGLAKPIQAWDRDR